MDLIVLLVIFGVISSFTNNMKKNATKQRPRFDGRLEFAMTLHPHVGDDSWIEPVIYEIKKYTEIHSLHVYSYVIAFHYVVRKGR